MSGPWCSAGAGHEPLAGTAPTQTHLLVVEAPGVWGREALSDCSLTPAQRADLAALPSHWRVLLARRADRPLRRAGDRRVWLSTPEGQARTWLLPLDAPLTPDALPGIGTTAGDALFVCTNGGRDRCCAVFGRACLDRLAHLTGPVEIWECSHLGGHRFAPTALRLRDRIVFGRIDDAAAGRLIAGETPLDQVRGAIGWPAPVQAAAVAVWRAYDAVPLREATVRPAGVDLVLQDGSAWSVPVADVEVPGRRLSCSAAPVSGTAPQPGRPQRTA